MESEGRNRDRFLTCHKLLHRQDERLSRTVDALLPLPQAVASPLGYIVGTHGESSCPLGLSDMQKARSYRRLNIRSLFRQFLLVDLRVLNESAVQ